MPTSSIRISSPSAEPELELRVRQDDAALRARRRRAARRASSVELLQPLERARADQVDGLPGRERQVVAGGRLRGRREDRLGETLGLDEPAGRRHAAHRPLRPYWFQPDPARYPRATHSIGTTLARFNEHGAAGQVGVVGNGARELAPGSALTRWCATRSAVRSNQNEREAGEHAPLVGDRRRAARRRTR